MTSFSLLQKVDVAKKIAQAPDKSYEIGVVIGSYLPFRGFGWICLLDVLPSKKKRQKPLKFLKFAAKFNTDE